MQTTYYIAATIFIILLLFINYTICLKVNHRNGLKKQLQIKSGIALIIITGIFLVISDFLIGKINTDISSVDFVLLLDFIKSLSGIYKTFIFALSWFVAIIFTGIGINLVTQGLCLDNDNTISKSNYDIEQEVIQSKPWAFRKPMQYIFNFLKSKDKSQ